MSKNLFYCCFLVVGILLNSCNKDEDIFPNKPDLKDSDISKFYNPDDFYFTGIINDRYFHLTEGKNNYQHYSGSQSSSSEGMLPMGRFYSGIDTYPVSVGDEMLFIISPLVDMSSKDQIKAMFSKRVLTLEEKREYILRYGKVMKAENGIPEIIENYYGTFDENSKLEITSFREQISIDAVTFQIAFQFECKLFDENKVLKGEIKQGEMVTLAYLWKN